MFNKETIKKIIRSNFYSEIIGIKLYNKINKLNLKITPDDKKFLKKQYKKKTGKELDLDNPKLFNEKIQWLKLNYRPEFLHQLADKCQVRNYIERQVGKKYLIPSYGCFKTYEEIPFASLPNKFIIKLANGSGQNKIIWDKNKINHKKLKKRIKTWQEIDHYAIGREWAYKHASNALIIEDLLHDSKGNVPKDYKVMCFNGEPRYIAVYAERDKELKRVIFNLSWEPLYITSEYQKNPDKFMKPKNLDEMLWLAKKLSQGLPFVRIDLYEHNDKIYFGEFTFYPKGGYMEFEDEEINQLLGNRLIIYQDHIE